VHPLLARLYAARGIAHAAELDTALSALLDPSLLKGAAEAATLLADAIAAKRRLLIVADYDCDGATACAVGVRALRAFGAAVAYLVPNRFDYGYGLTPEVVRLAAERKPDIIITVDNGIASVDGVAEAKRLGISHAHHRPPPARRRTAGGRLHRQPQPARLRLPEQVHRRRRRDVLRHAGAARGAEEARRLQRQRRSRTSPPCSTSSPSARWPTW
jgi:hypothetical protein